MTADGRKPTAFRVDDEGVAFVRDGERTPHGAAVVIEAVHTCMTCRGVKKPGAVMVTSAVRGVCASNPPTRAEAMSLLHK